MPSSLSNIRTKLRPIRSQLRQIMDRLQNSDRGNYPTEKVAVWGPTHETINFIKGTGCRHIAEIGVFKGHTSMEFAKFLDGEGELHLFDYEDRVTSVVATLKHAGFRNVRAFGSSYKLMDSYNWSLAKLIDENTGPIYDYVFLDGAHNWAIDALTTFLADRMLKVGGYLDFDDYNWTLCESPSLNPKSFPLTRKLYTAEQIASKQAKMILDLIVRVTQDIGKWLRIRFSRSWRKESATGTLPTETQPEKIFKKEHRGI
jgi:predicted O-methyltransferase YrrM